MNQRVSGSFTNPLVLSRWLTTIGWSTETTYGEDNEGVHEWQTQLSAILVRVERGEVLTARRGTRNLRRR